VSTSARATKRPARELADAIGLDRLDALPGNQVRGKRARIGAIFGTLIAAAIAGGAIGPWATGLAYDLAGSYAPGFYLAVACCAFSAAAIWKAGPREIRAVAGRLVN
jgi:hypothetical protein